MVFQRPLWTDDALGLYSLPAGEWKGQQCEYIGEWIQSRFRIPGKEYGQLASAFNPVGFDAEEIVTLAKDCGMRYIVLTSKHHEGLCHVSLPGGFLQRL